MSAHSRIGLALALAALIAAGCSGGPAGGDTDADDEDAFDAGDGAPADADRDDAGVDAEVDGDGDTDAAVDTDADGDEDAGCDPLSEPPLVDMGVVELGERRAGLVVEPCTRHELFVVAPEGAQLEVELTPRGMFPFEAGLYYPDDPTPGMELASVRAERFGVPVGFEARASRPGELAIVVRSESTAMRQSYDLEVRCLEGCDREVTRFPIFLVHGWTGFDEIGPIDYFWNVPSMLSEHGYWVGVAQLDPYNSIEVRSEQLADQVDEALRDARARKINIIAHSQGGLDSRALITHLGYGDRVSSLTTIATPHRGTPLTDVALGILPGPGEEALYFLLELLGATVVGSESDAEASFRSMTQDYVQNVFNPATPDDPRVDYISWTGRTCLFGISCDDVCDVEIRWSYDIIYAISGENDGIVPVSSAIWGDYRGEVPADHFDEVGQLFGVTNPNFDHEAFYLERARDLAAEGH